MGKLNKLSCVASVVLAGECYLTKFITFMDAYLGGTMKVVVTINDYGEANFELALLIVAFPVILLGFRDYLVKTFQ